MLQALDLFPGSGVKGWLKQVYIVTKGMPGIIHFDNLWWYRWSLGLSGWYKIISNEAVVWNPDTLAQNANPLIFLSSLLASYPFIYQLFFHSVKSTLALEACLVISFLDSGDLFIPSLSWNTFPNHGFVPSPEALSWSIHISAFIKSNTAYFVDRFCLSFFSVVSS